MDKTKQIRAKNVKFLIDTECGGNKSEFARRVESTPQHVSKVLRALDADADQLKETAKKYVGDDMAKRIESAFRLDAGALSTGLLSDKTAVHNVIADVFGASTGARPLIRWEDIEDYLSGKNSIDISPLSLPANMSQRAFVSRLPEYIGTSVAQLAAPGDLVAVEPNTIKNDLQTNSYVIVKIDSDKNHSCWKVKKIGNQLLLIDEDYPDRPFEGSWELIGQIKFSIKGL